MEQRRLRLGDILDDYCPRERRVTNHAVVAMIEDDVKQTRCTTCDAEHAYKGAKVPRKRKKETPGTLYREVLAGMAESEPAPVLSAPSVSAGDPPAEDATFGDAEPSRQDDEPAEGSRAPMHASDSNDGNDASAAMSDDVRDEPELDAPPAPAEEGPVHRPLIRATLPRPEGQKEERRMPDFTVRHNAGRGNGNFRGGDMRGKQRGGHGGGATGNRPHGGPRFAGARPGAGGRGQGRGAAPSGFRSGQPQRQPGGRKRSR